MGFNVTQNFMLHSFFHVAASSYFIYRRRRKNTKKIRSLLFLKNAILVNTLPTVSMRNYRVR